MHVKIQDQLKFTNASVCVHGHAGKLLETCRQGVMAKDHRLYTRVFREKSDKGGLFAGEFWGKWFTSAALADAYRSTPESQTMLAETVRDLCAAQEDDGRLSSCPTEDTLVNWDVWGRKYALLGLVAFYDRTGEQQALTVACRALDELIEIVGPGKRKLTETGLKVLGSMSSTSILEPVALIYQRTGKQAYLDFAEYLATLFSEPNAYTAHGMRLVEDALNGVPPVRISSPKAYEMMSCYEGLIELYRATGKSAYKDAAVAFGDALLEREIMITGSGSSAELWCDGIFRQTEMLEQPMETCVTATWMKFCTQLLRLTGDPKWADQLEISFFNAAAGAMADEGHWWAYYSPLVGERMPSPMQMPSCQSSCCVASGPRGMMTLPGWSVMSDGAGPVVNFYGHGEWNLKTPKGQALKLVQRGSYPETDTVEIELECAPEVFTLSLRIPAWSKQGTLMVNDEPVDCTPGSYCRIDRNWQTGDRITLQMDLRGRVLRSPGNVNALAIMRGPIVLALDSRMVETADYNLWLHPEGTPWTEQREGETIFRYVLPQPTPEVWPETFIELKPSDNKPENVWMTFEVPFLYKYTHFFDHELKTLTMCDYASAGNEYRSENGLRTWLPQPLFMGELFPRESWHILYREGQTRPVFPRHQADTASEAENTWEKT